MKISMTIMQLTRRIARTTAIAIAILSVLEEELSLAFEASLGLVEAMVEVILVEVFKVVAMFVLAIVLLRLTSPVLDADVVGTVLLLHSVARRSSRPPNENGASAASVEAHRSVVLVVLKLEEAIVVTMTVYSRHNKGRIVWMAFDAASAI